jgi:tRNA threonylcarbamoyl adenosine modification protein (Sua5/YciO/YrdC/YwlC family)
MTYKTEVLKIDSNEEAPLAAARGVEVLAAGGLVAFPTETVYGIAANAANDKTFARLRKLKSRPDQPFTVHIGQVDQVKAYVAEPPATARILMQKAWPGPITIILPTGGKLANEAWNGAIAARLVHKSMIALRCPDHPVAQFLLEAMTDPIVAPSAKLAGRKPATSAEEVLAELDGQIDLVLDGGKVRYGLPSTIVEFKADGSYKIVREGVVPRLAVAALTRRQVLFVCSGNTCRSPMAQALALKYLAGQLGVRPQELEAHGWRVLSAGTSAESGAPASEAAIAAMRQLGLDLSSHSSHLLTAELIHASDLILCMTDRHVESALALDATAAGRVVRLDVDGDVPDPIGGPLQQYLETAERIRRALEARLNDLLHQAGQEAGQP